MTEQVSLSAAIGGSVLVKVIQSTESFLHPSSKDGWLFEAKKRSSSFMASFSMVLCCQSFTLSSSQF